MVDKKNKKISSEMERLIEKFAFNKFSKKHQNCLKRAEEGLHSLFSIHEDMLSKEYLNKMFVSDALEIKSKFENQSISREDAKDLYIFLNELLDKAERILSEKIEQFQKFREQTNRNMEELLSIRGVPIKRVIEELQEEIDKIRKTLPKIQFGILDIGVESTKIRDVKEIHAFFEDHLSGILVIPEEKKELSSNLPNDNFIFEEKVLNKKIIFTFISEGK